MKVKGGWTAFQAFLGTVGTLVSLTFVVCRWEERAEHRLVGLFRWCLSHRRSSTASVSPLLIRSHVACVLIQNIKIINRFWRTCNCFFFITRVAIEESRTVHVCRSPLPPPSPLLPPSSPLCLPQRNHYRQVYFFCGGDHVGISTQYPSPCCPMRCSWCLSASLFSVSLCAHDHSPNVSTLAQVASEKSAPSVI